MRFGTRHLKIFFCALPLALASCGGGVQTGDTESKFAGVQAATALSPNTVRINWKRNDKVKQYKVYEANSAEPLEQSPFDFVTIKSLTADTPYTFKVVGEVQSGVVGMDKEIRVRTWPRFTGPTKMEAGASADTINVSWDYSEKPLEYLVFISVDTPPTALTTNDWKTPTQKVTSKSYTITNVQPSKMYYVAVHAHYTEDEYERPTKVLSLRSNTTFKTPNYSLSKISIGTLPYISVDPIPDATHLRSGFRSQAFWKGNPVSDPLQGAGNIVFSSGAGLPIGKVSDISLKVEYGTGAATETLILEGLETYIKGISSHIEGPQATSLPQGASYFGKALARGDFNCDGGQDLAVGVPDIGLSQYGTSARSGAVYIYYSKKVGDRYVLQTSGTPLQTPVIPGTDPQIITMDDLGTGAAFGIALAGGNLNGDKLGTHSCDDLLVGAPGAKSSGGAAFVFFGSSNGLRASSHVRDMAENTETCDGKIEGATCTGVILYPNSALLPPSLSGNTAYAPYVGLNTEVNGRFGAAVAFIGDFDANGYQDIAVGAPSRAWAGKITGYFANNGYLANVGMVSIYVGSKFGIGKAAYNGQQVREINIYPPIPEEGMNFGSSISGGADVDGRNKIRLSSGDLVGGAEMIIGAPGFKYNDYSTKGPFVGSIGTTALTSVISPAGGGWIVPNGTATLSSTTNYYGWPQNSDVRVGAAFLYYGYSRTTAFATNEYDNSTVRDSWWACGRRGMSASTHFSCLASQDSYSILFPRNNLTRNFGSAVALVGDASRYKENTNETIEPRTSSDPTVPYQYYSDGNGDGYADVIVGASLSTVGSKANVGNLWQFFGNPQRWFGASDLYNVSALSTPSPAADYAINNASCDIFNAVGKKVNCLPVVLQSTSLAVNSYVAANGNQLAVGDVTGDGLKDIVVGVAGETTLGVQSGAVLVYPSSKSAGITSSYKKLYAQQTSAKDSLGTSVTVGDFNGDFQTYQENVAVTPTLRPLMDVFGGAPNDTSQTPSIGTVFGFLTSNNSPLPSVMGYSSDGQGGSMILTEKQASFLDYGVGDIALVGDINGDGHDDAIAKITEYLPDGSLKTDVAVFFGSAVGLVTKDFCLNHKDLIFTGAGSDSLCYASVVPVTGVTKPGITLPQRIVRPNNLTGQWFIKAVDAGDVNKDGFGDVLFMGPTTVIFFGARGGLQNVVDPTFTPNVGDPQMVSRLIDYDANALNSNWAHGEAMLYPVFRNRVAVGDFNGDGFADVILGMPSQSSDPMNSVVGDDTHLHPSESGVTSGGGWNCGITSDTNCLNGARISDHGMIWIFYGSSRGYQTPAVQGLTIGDMTMGGPGTMSIMDTEAPTNAGTCVAVSGDASQCMVGYMRNPVFENIAFGYNRLSHSFGASVEAMKIDRDIYDDVLVSAPGFTDLNCYTKAGSPPTSYGRIYMLYGSAKGIVASVKDDYFNYERTGLTCPVAADVDPGMGIMAASKMRAISPPVVNATQGVNNRQRNLGEFMSVIGDVNGDGYEDFAVTHPLESVRLSTGEWSTLGTAYVYYGPLCPLDNDPNITEWFQSDMASGYRINAQTYTSGTEPVGTPSQYIYNGNYSAPGVAATCMGKPLPLKFQVLGSSNDERYGFGLSRARLGKGDFNGDRLDDFMMGSYTSTDPQSGKVTVGRGVVFFGSQKGLNVADYPTLSLSTGVNGLYRPLYVSPKTVESFTQYFKGNITVGDVNNDGTADYLVPSARYNGSGNLRGINIGTFFLFY